MTDPRVSKLAQVLVNYSLDLKPGEKFLLASHPLAEELSLEVYKQALLAGAHVIEMNSLPGAKEIFFKYASDEQLEFISPIDRLVTESFPAILDIEAIHNSRELSGVDPTRQRLNRAARAELSKIFLQQKQTILVIASSTQQAEQLIADLRFFAGLFRPVCHVFVPGAGLPRRLSF